MSFTKIVRKQYEKLEVGFPLPHDLEQEIQSFLDYLNNSETIHSTIIKENVNSPQSSLSLYMIIM